MLSKRVFAAVPHFTWGQARKLSTLPQWSRSRLSTLLNDILTVFEGESYHQAFPCGPLIQTIQLNLRDYHQFSYTSSASSRWGVDFTLVVFLSLWSLFTSLLLTPIGTLAHYLYSLRLTITFSLTSYYKKYDITDALLSTLSGNVITVWLIPSNNSKFKICTHRSHTTFVLTCSMEGSSVCILYPECYALATRFGRCGRLWTVLQQHE